MPPTRPVTGRLPNSGPSRVIRACSARRFDQEPSDDSSNSKSKRRGVSQSLNSLRQDLSKRQQEKLRQEGAAQRMKDMNDLTVRARIALNELAYDNAGEASADDWKEVPLGMTFPGEDDDEEVDYVTEYSVERAEATYNVIVDAVRGAYYITSVPRVTRRDRKHRLAKLAASWEHQIEDLSATYLQWKHRDQEIGLPNVEESSFWEVKLISWARYLPHQRIPLLHDSTVNNPINQLAQLGFLSSSPLRPTLAFSFETLETFRLLSNRCPRLSKQAFVKALCDSHQRLYSSTLRQQFSDTFDTYLSILRCVDRHVNISLSRDAPDWRIRHSCPACQNRLEVEGDLEYTIKLSLDGNNSLKRFGEAGSADKRTFSSNYFLSREEVGAFSAVVSKGSQKTQEKKRTKDKADEETDEDIALQMQTDGTEVVEDNWVTKNMEIGGVLDSVVSVCVERWKANADDSKKGMFNCFEESGVFLACCRHGLTLIACDMVASGELAKYPLAILSHINDNIAEKKLIGYDIGCAFKKTAAISSITGLENVKWVVPAMHGYAHNRPCQLVHHPKYVVGTGIEDFETCERTFSLTNHCAAVTRLATPFHRHQVIDAQLRQCDADKYASLGIFILNNYKQALTIVEEYSDIFSQVYKLEGCKHSDFTAWLAEEGAYLSGLSREPEEESIAIAYVEALEKWRQAKEEHETQYKQLEPLPAESSADELGKRRVKCTYKAAYERVGQCLELVCELEEQLGVNSRWTVECTEFIKTKELMRTRKYRLALDRLESLVVQRLFELQKSHLGSTGYKLRVQIAKHLQRHSEAIRTALNNFNAAARALNSDHVNLKFTDLLQHSFVGEFDLLQNAREDIRDKPWASPANPILTDQYF